MSKTSLIENQWVDIVIPTAPDSQLLLWWSLVFVLLMVVSFGVYFIWQRQPRQQLRRNMRRLLSFPSTLIDPKNKLRQLEQALCQHCHAVQLSKIKLDNTNWNTFKQQLQQACYQAQPVNEQHAIELIKQAQTIFLEANS